MLLDNRFAGKGEGQMIALVFFVINFIFIIEVYYTVGLDSAVLVFVGSIIGSLVGLNFALEKQDVTE